jgi:hypothetical protein
LALPLDVELVSGVESALAVAEPELAVEVALAVGELAPAVGRWR